MENKEVNIYRVVAWNGGELSEVCTKWTTDKELADQWLDKENTSSVILSDQKPYKHYSPYSIQTDKLVNSEIELTIQTKLNLLEALRGILIIDMDRLRSKIDALPIKEGNDFTFLSGKLYGVGSALNEIIKIVGE